jgi:murein DD-endopeptidase MepM/ murein hydrolase activator NlpD
LSDLFIDIIINNGAYVRVLFLSIIAICLFVLGTCHLFRMTKIAPPIDDIAGLLNSFEPTCNLEEYLSVGVSIAPKINTENKHQKTDNFSIIEDGQSLHSILKAQGISEYEIAQVGLALKPYLLDKDLALGDLYWFEIKKTDIGNFVSKFIIKKLDINRVPILYTITRGYDDAKFAQFSTEVSPALIKEKYSLLTLEIKGSLYQTFSQIPFGTELMQKLMHILIWKLRMPEQILPNDRIVVLVKQRLVDKTLIGYGDIERIIYTQKHQQLTMLHFVSHDKKIDGFFEENGNSVEREFLSSPVKEPITTSDQKWRFHPVRKMRMRHNGLDYRGVIGTEFFSIADGKVIEKRFDVNVGNMIRIEHKYGVFSEYFHANSLDKKLDVGSSVKRGQFLGTIGRTGKLCTGPHLHMGLYRMHNDQRKYINMASLRKILKPASSINENYKKEFKEHLLMQYALMESQKQHKIVADKVPQL